MGCEYCELSSGGTAARFSSTWGGAGTDEEGASGLVTKEMGSISLCRWIVRGNVVEYYTFHSLILSSSDLRG